MKNIEDHIELALECLDISDKQQTREGQEMFIQAAQVHALIDIAQSLREFNHNYRIQNPISFVGEK